MKTDKQTFLGLLIIGVVSLSVMLVAQTEFFEALSISPLIIAIFVGMVLVHTIKSKYIEYLHQAMSVSTKEVLRFGIILYGFRLTLQNLFEVGFLGFIYACLIVITTFFIGYFVGTKLLKMDKEITILTTIGSSIYGAAAVLATNEVIKAHTHKSAVAVSTVVIFGTFAMLLYPFLFNIDFFSLNAHHFGLFLGGTLHEVAHAVAGGNAINSEVANSAVIEKMIRVILLAPFLLILTFVQFKKQIGNEKQKITIPWFAVLFIGIIFFNSLNFFPKDVIVVINEVDTFLLTMAMLALGLQTHISKFKSVGAKPFYLAAILFVWLFVGGYNMLYFLVMI
ncbi:MAG: YeiH family protein [Arcobacteraceae bacterium]